jgi:hypothetical protein
MLGLRKRRHARLRAKPLPPEWQSHLSRNIPYTDKLTPDERRQLVGLIHIFLDEKHFEGCNGLAITDEIRVTIAAQACILMLNRPTERLYPKLRTIFVYPDAFLTPGQRTPDGLLVQEDPSVTLGQSWHRGPVVVSWRNVLAGAASDTDGENVVFHEFAHQLDAEEGSINGAPHLQRGSMYAAWSKVFATNYEELQQDLHDHHKNLLGAYAATNPAEFFAVATERFFERPADLQRQSPELYEQLKQFYQQDPAERFNAND